MHTGSGRFVTKLRHQAEPASVSRLITGHAEFAEKLTCRRIEFLPGTGWQRPDGDYVRRPFRHLDSVPVRVNRS